MSGKEKRVLPRPLPRAEFLDAEFWAHCREERLCFQRCKSCETWRHFPRILCAGCGSDAWEWARSCGRGHIYSWTVTHEALHPAFADETPYALIVVELEEGVRIVSRLRDLDPAEIELDLLVEVCFEEVGEDTKLPYFRPR
jgi:uncharacterized OB-fold protein